MSICLWRKNDMLVPDSATPLYLQLEEILRQEILSGSRREGDKLSTENELVEQYTGANKRSRKNGL
jgi:DNA-binding GntR family transcriptional regulator